MGVLSTATASARQSGPSPTICFSVETGSLYPALHRLEKRGWLKAEWGVSEANQRAKFYRLTAAGKAQLSREQDRWSQLVTAIGRIMNPRRRTHPDRRVANADPITTSCDDEIRGHMALSIKERIERGEDPEAARLAALKEFGNVTLTPRFDPRRLAPALARVRRRAAARHPHRDALADARQGASRSRWR